MIEASAQHVEGKENKKKARGRPEEVRDRSKKNILPNSKQPLLRLEHRQRRRERRSCRDGRRVEVEDVGVGADLAELHKDGPRWRRRGRG